jgi:hypothetical protein|tara:strand:- start:1114 stop:1572 length:459 start_codon:yes stop_codon:yes gene_type:complete
MAQVEGTAYWASLSRPNEKFEPMWRIDLALDDDTAAQFAKEGFTLSETTIDGDTVKNIIKFKRKVSKNNGDKNQPPMIVDGAKKPLDKIVGNGSKVVVMYKSYDWNYKGKTGKGLDLQAVQVKDLVEYTPKEDFDIIESAEGNTDSNIKEDF